MTSGSSPPTPHEGSAAAHESTDAAREGTDTAHESSDTAHEATDAAREGTDNAHELSTATHEVTNAAHEATRLLGGHAAAWQVIAPEVEDEAGARLPAEPIGLYVLADPESAIDRTALLRERSLPDPPYWALVWTGARAIAAAVAGFELDGRRVLDLGCGLGLSGLVAARAGASVTFGDYLEEPLEFVRASIEAARVVGADVRRLDFTRDRFQGRENRFDLILAADVVYDPAHYTPLALFLDAHLAPGGVVLLTESLRADAAVFLAGMRARGFRDTRRALWVHEDGRRERTWLHELRRRHDEDDAIPPQA